MLKYYLVINIGCIECEVSSNIVGVFDNKEKATAIAELCTNEYSWRESGHNHFEVFEIPELNIINSEYSKISV